MDPTRLVGTCALALLLAALLPMAMAHAGGALAAGTLPVTAEPLTVDPLLQSLPESDGPLTLDQVRGALGERFESHGTRVVNHGFDTTAYWYRVRLDAPGGRAAPATWVLEFAYPLLNYIDIHIVWPGDAVETLLSGNQRVPPPGQLRSRTLAFPVTVAPGASLELYFRVATESTHLLNLKVWVPSAFAEKERTENMWFGMFFGLMAGMALYNFFVLLTMRDIAYVYHVLYIVTIMAIQFDLHGFSRLHLWGGPGWTNVTIPLFIALPAMFSVLFTRNFLQTRRHTPALHRTLSALLVVLAACAVLAVAAPYTVSMPLLSVVAAVVSFLLVVTGVTLLLKGVREARFYLLAWSIYLVAVVLRVLEAIGVLAPTLWTEYGVQIGSSAVVTLLSLALADRVAAANIELERRVEEKRAHLDESYRRMQALERTQAIAQERERIMRDLHDGIGGQLVTALNLARLQGSPQPAIEQTLRDAMDDMRLVVDSLDPVEGDLLLVLATLRGRFEPRLEQQGLRFAWQVRDIPSIPDFGPDKALQVLRIVQEAITNIVKHARARTVTVRTGTQADGMAAAPGVFVEVADDGRGMPHDSKPGRGLGNMRERARRIGGQFAVDSGASGTTVRLWLPLPAPAEAGPRASHVHGIAAT